MSFGLKRTKKTEAVMLEESLGNTHTYTCEPTEKGKAWARPIWRPEFRELDLAHLQERDWLR